MKHQPVRQSQTTTLGTMCTTFFDKCVGSLMSPANHVTLKIHEMGLLSERHHQLGFFVSVTSELTPHISSITLAIKELKQTAMAMSPNRRLNT